MLIGIPKEIKNNENRVGLTSQAYKAWSRKAIKVLVETNAGLGFADEDYTKQRAPSLRSRSFWAAEMVVKVKEP